MSTPEIISVKCSLVSTSREIFSQIANKAQQTLTLVYSGLTEHEQGESGLAFAGLIFGSTAAVLGTLVAVEAKGDTGLLVGGLALIALGVAISIGGCVLENH